MSLATEYAQRADEYNRARAILELNQMHDYIKQKALLTAKKGLKWLRINVHAMHRDLGYLVVEEVERSYYMSEDRYHEENGALTELLRTDGFAVQWSGSFDTRVIDIRFPSPSETPK